MTYTQEEVDRIVAEVLRRIRSLRDAKSESFSIRERVVSLAVIDKLSEQVQSIIVPHDAIITPSVQDELRYRKIRIQRETSNDSFPSLIVANEDKRRDLKTLNNLASLEILGATELPELLKQLTSMISANVQGLITTENPEQALVLANRSANITAFFGYSIQNIRRAHITIQPNVMVLDSTINTTQLKNYVRTFLGI